MTREPVILNVYEIISGVNFVTSSIGLGIYHSGVQVHDVEYAFFGHDGEDTGVFEMIPCDEDGLGEHFRFKCSIPIGETELSETEVDEIVSDMAEDFPGNSHHLTNRNCNHFSRRFIKILCDKDIPSWVNRSANVGSWFWWSIQPFSSVVQLCTRNFASVQKNR